jgi:hypothetical protein
MFGEDVATIPCGSGASITPFSQHLALDTTN